MSDVNDTASATATPDTDESPKKRGQSKKSEAELRAAFDSLQIDAFLEVEMADNGNSRCTVRTLDLESRSMKTVISPVAGNTFMKMVEGARALGPLVGTATDA